MPARQKPLKIALTVLLVIVALVLCAAPVSAQGVSDGATRSPAASSAAHTTWLTFGLDGVSALQHRPFADIPLWQYLASLIYIFLAFAVARFADFIIGVKARNWAKKTKTSVDDVLIELLRGPVKIITFVILLHVGIRVYAWPEAMAAFISKALTVIVAISITYVLVRAIDVLISVWQRRALTEDNGQVGHELLPLIRKTLKVFVVVVAALVTSDNLGVNVTGIIASLSIGGLAVGLAAQDTLANLFGAMAVLMDKPFRVGDRIQLGAVDGFVEAIGFRSTRVRNLDGHLVAIPNKEVGNATIINIQLRPNIRTVMTFGLTYDTSPDKVEQATKILRAVYSEHPMTHDVWISFNQFGNFSLNIQVIHWWASTDYKAYLADMQEMNLQIKRRFATEGIEFAFPTQTIYMKPDTGPNPPPATATAAPSEPRLA